MPRTGDRLSRQVLTVAQMRAAEDALIAAGTPVGALMERAGRGAGEWVRRMAAGRRVTVLCGPGNNGGDGYVIARHLADHGHPVQVVAAADPATPAAVDARRAFAGPVHGPERSVAGDVLVDCLFGSGLTRPLGDRLFFLLSGLAEAHPYRIAIDLPSGVEADSGAALDPGLPHWHLTLALGAWKHAHFAMPAAATMGALRLVDIGVGPVEGAARLLARPVLADPAPDAHKYRRGLLAVVAGAMPGAPLLAAEAAMRAGAGYVKLLADTDIARPPDLVLERGDLSTALADARIGAVLVGPGLGRDGTARARLAAVLEAERPAVIDADALMLFGPDLPGAAPCVLTPHEGELAALERAFALDSDRPRRARALAVAEASGAVVLLKGPDSLIAVPGGEVIVASRASAWLSVAGSGDVLAGIIASRLAMTGDTVRAACEGLWLHGQAARLAGPAFTAGDLARTVARALS